MRSRPNATPRRSEASSGGDGAAKKIIQEGGVDYNGKDKPKFKRPPKAFALPPPPKLASLSVRNGAAATGEKHASQVNGAVTGQNGKSSDRDDSENLAVNVSTANSSSKPALPLPPAPSVPIPPPPSSTSAVYQRANRKPQTSNKNTAASPLTPSRINNKVVAPKTSISSDSYTNTYPTQHSQISHPYKPSSWYADARYARRKRQITNTVFSAVLAIFLSVFLWWGYQQYLISVQNVGRNRERHHKKYHHHDVHHNFHPMMGIVESPVGFAKLSSKERRSYRQMEQEHTSHDRSQSHDQLSHARKDVFQQTSTHDIFSTFPVKTLSNERLLPYVGFGVTSRSVEHKQIPIIVSTLLQYASSETEGGGGIALIDAVIDEDRKLQNDGGSLQYSITNKVVERYEEEEEKLESSMAKTAVALVGRAISFFGKEKNKLQGRGSAAIMQSIGADSKDNHAPYDYENRLEVHLVVGLSGPDLGLENTVAALQHIVAELDGLVPLFPRDVLHTDPTEWAIQSSSLPLVDRHVDVRLHVLLRLNHCHDSSHQLRVAPCSDDEAANKELLEQFIASYEILEKLYTAKVIHGIGLDGTRGKDIGYLLQKSTIKPQLYRGDVSQALYILRKNYSPVEDEHIAATLKEHNITFLASNVAGHILERKPMAPNAYALLQNLGGVIYRAHHEMLDSRAAGDVAVLSTTGQAGEGQYYTVPRIVLAYLVRHEVCVLPHAYKAEHLADDAPEWVGGLASFLTERRVAEIGAALRALLSEEDLPEDHGLGIEGEEEVAAVFHNLLSEEVHISRGEENSSLGGAAVKGSGSIVIIAKTGDKFIVHGAGGQKRAEYTVTAKGGGADEFSIPIEL